MIEPILRETPGDDPELAAALRAARLPTDDLIEPGRCFFRWEEEGRLIGFVGWETDGSAQAILRSLVVSPFERGQGRGGVLIDWALARLAERGATEVYLLTTSIERLAARHGFVRLDRSEAPPIVRNSRQFAQLCPASAVLMGWRSQGAPAVGARNAS